MSGVTAGWAREAFSGSSSAWQKSLSHRIGKLLQEIAVFVEGARYARQFGEG